MREMFKGFENEIKQEQETEKWKKQAMNMNEEEKDAEWQKLLKHQEYLKNLRPYRSKLDKKADV